MNGIDWPLVGLLIGVGAVALLAGAALGFFTASTDLKREQGKAWDRGYLGGALNAQQAAQRGGTVSAWHVNPYSGQEPPLIRHDGDGTHLAIFDQDAPTDAAKAIELRGDD